MMIEDNVASRVSPNTGSILNATIAELQGYVSAKERERSLSAEQAELIQSELEPLAGETPDSRLFEAPRHWGAFVVYGE